MFGLGVFSMVRRHALVSLRHALVSLRHAAPSQRHAALFKDFNKNYYLKTDDKLTNCMTYGGSYTSVLLRLPCWISLSSAQVQASSCTNCVQCLFIGPEFLIRQPLFYDFTVADP